MAFQPIKQKDANKWLIKNIKYSFKEDWLLQASKLGFEKFIDWVSFLDQNYNSADLIRNYYICPESKCFEEPAGVRVFFTNLKQAQQYCAKLNEEG